MPAGVVKYTLKQGPVLPQSNCGGQGEKKLFRRSVVDECGGVDWGAFGTVDFDGNRQGKWLADYQRFNITPPETCT